MLEVLFEGDPNTPSCRSRLAGDQRRHGVPDTPRRPYRQQAGSYRNALQSDYLSILTFLFHTLIIFAAQHASTPKELLSNGCRAPPGRFHPDRTDGGAGHHRYRQRGHWPEYQAGPAAPAAQGCRDPGPGPASGPGRSPGRWPADSLAERQQGLSLQPWRRPGRRRAIFTRPATAPTGLAEHTDAGAYRPGQKPAADRRMDRRTVAPVPF